MESQETGTQGTSGDEPLREEDVTRGDALNDDVREGDAGDLPGDGEDETAGE